MAASPSGPQVSADLVCGDYLRVSAERAAVRGHGVDAGFARIERIEHLPAEKAEAVFDYRFLAFGPVPVVWCHGLPGPVLLRGGDVTVLDVASPERIQHDQHHPWWPAADDVLLRAAQPAGTSPDTARREHERRVDEVAWPDPAAPDRADQRATSFAKPASALLSGDYLGIHPNRWPAVDRDVDEGFARIEHLHRLDATAATAVFADPSWHTDVVVASVYGMHGVLLLRGNDEVAVLAFVNPERDAWERRDYWTREPLFLLRGSHEPTAAETEDAERVDAARRPDCTDEAALYPSKFRDPFTRRMGLESLHGFRSMPLAALPWPHRQSDCPLGTLAEHYRDYVPDARGAHAAATLSRRGQQIRSSCPYHQVDWPRLVRMLEETLAEGSDELPLVGTHPEYGQLAPDEQKWLDALAVDPIKYNDGSETLVNGQHRLCALRFAGVQRCPVDGDYLPETDYGTSQPVRADARAEVAASWRRMADENAWPSWITSVARFLPASWRSRLLAATPSQHRRAAR